MKKIEWRSIEASILSTCEKDLQMVEVSRMMFTVADCVIYFFNSVEKKKHFKRF